ncbi:MAG: tRNA pseudouridine(55) synthase TruB [Planctomycetes bacterium]|nr:tRNA pseudouridine(55) synthase TruB [Planctomycetota bacterium]
MLKEWTGNSGIIVVNKPKGMSSRTAVDHVQGWFAEKIPTGHAGTLDPLATGVLVICLGWTTRLVEYIQAMKKVYKTEIMLGAISETDDSEGPIKEILVERTPTLIEIQTALRHFEGEILQTPPSVSAARINGKRSYRLARKGKPELPPPKNVEVSSIHIIKYEYPLLELEITCGKGTYIRSIARDLGQLLKTGGYVLQLERTSIGNFTLEDSHSLNEPSLESKDIILPQELALEKMQKLSLEGLILRYVLNGTKTPYTFPNAKIPTNNIFAIMDTNNKFRAIAEYRPNDKVLKALKVFPFIDPNN